MYKTRADQVSLGVGAVLTVLLSILPQAIGSENKPSEKPTTATRSTPANPSYGSGLRPQLAGIGSGFSLVVAVNPLLEQLGGTGESVRSAAKRALKEAGIQVFQDARMPMITVAAWATSVDALSAKGLVNVAVEVHVHEQLTTVSRRENRSVVGSVWTRVSSRVYSHGDQGVRDGLAKIIDLFVKDYLAANK